MDFPVLPENMTGFFTLKSAIIDFVFFNNSG